MRVYGSQGGLARVLLTDAAGNVTFDSLPAGAYRAVASFTVGGRQFSGYYDFASRVSTLIWVQEVISPEATRPILGTNQTVVNVYDQTGRNPVSGAHVRLRDEFGAVVAEYRSDSSGRVAFWQLAEQRYTVEASTTGGTPWTAPTGATFKDFHTTGSRGWTPRILVGTPATLGEFVVSGQRNRYLASDRGGLATDSDFGSRIEGTNQTTADLALLNRPGIAIASGETDQRLLQALREGMAPAGTLATDVVAPLFVDWTTPLPSGTGAVGKGLSKPGSTLVLDNSGKPIQTRVLRHDEKSLLSLELGRTQSFRDYSRGLADQFRQAITLQAGTGKINLDAINVTLPTRPSYGPGPSVQQIIAWLRSPSSLARIIGGTQGGAARLENFKVNPRGVALGPNSLVNYSADLVVVFADDFGVNHSDVENADLGAGVAPVGARGLRSQWVLQHERNARPFVNEIVVRVPITGSFRIPLGFGTLADRTT